MSKHIGFHEIFAMHKLTYEEVSCSISKSLAIPISKIGNQYNFFDLLLEETSLLLGIDIDYYSEGYTTFIKLVSTIEFSDNEYYSMCAKLSLNLDMNVVVYSLQEEGDIFVFYPDWNYQKAVEDDDDDDKFIVHVYGDKSNVDDLIK